MFLELSVLNTGLVDGLHVLIVNGVPFNGYPLQLLVMRYQLSKYQSSLISHAHIPHNQLPELRDPPGSCGTFRRVVLLICFSYHGSLKQGLDDADCTLIIEIVVADIKVAEVRFAKHLLPTFHAFTSCYPIGTNV